jgi:hypothetical protein
MIERSSWIKRIEETWEEAPIVWLSGVKGVGKTTLIEGLGTQRTLRVDCDPARSAHIALDPELFFRACDRPVVVFDDVLRLPDAIKVLKTGADLFRELRIIATSSPWRRTGRPVMPSVTGSAVSTSVPFCGTNCLLQRFAREAVPSRRAPEALLMEHRQGGFYRGWMDAFFDRDIREPFGFRDSTSSPRSSNIS